MIQEKIPKLVRRLEMVTTRTGFEQAAWIHYYKMPDGSELPALWDTRLKCYRLPSQFEREKFTRLAASALTRMGSHK